MNRGSRVNPFEIALWAVSAVLTIGGVSALIWAVGRLGGGRGPDDAGFTATQTIFSLAPAAVTAGLIALVVALALRAALLVVARRAASADNEERRADFAAANAPVEPSVPPPSPSSAPQQDPLPFEAPRLRNRQRAIDHSAFKRPGTE